MGEPLMEIVPNIAEGRRAAVVDEIAAAFAGAGAALLDRSSDPDHHRTVLTLAGPPAALVEGAVAGARACARLLDLRGHAGVHPRAGALDVLPFVPLGGTPMAACVDAARAAARRLAADAGLPVYLYGEAALRPERARLPAVRNRGFEALRQLALADPDLAPDLGGPGLHLSAGAVSVGARPVLIAFNVELASDDLALARRVAAAVRERDGGLPGVRALGVALPSRGRVQVSMNLVDHRRTAPAAAFAAVAALCRRAGVAVAASEIVGLVPAAALEGTDLAALRLRGFRGEQVLEERLRRAGLRPGPGGG